jgi:hypothetical protein
MTTQSIAIVKQGSDAAFRLRVETPDDSTYLGIVSVAAEESGADAADRALSGAGYDRTDDWNYAVAAGYLVATVEMRNAR